MNNVPVSVDCPSKSQVNKAGKLLRKLDAETSIEQVNWAFDVLLAFRAAHQYPLGKANMGLRSMVTSEGCEVEISQRLKRATTILDKLFREPTMQLANMQDIGGCRAVLNSIDEIRRVERRVKKRRPPVRLSGYISEPRSSGYRGVHLIVEYDNRMIELQLRTRVMHEWAIAVERLSGRFRVDFKSGSGPAEVLDLLEAISEAMAIEERGETVDELLLQRVSELRRRADPYLRGGSG